jgi:hypothetical protein
MHFLVLVTAGFVVLAILRYQALIGRNGRLRHPFVTHSNGIPDGGDSAPKGDPITYAQIQESTQCSH